MSRGGAPTGQWETLPPLLKANDFDLATAEARLIVERPGAEPVEIKIEQKEFVIGRQTDAVDLVLDDDQVSKRHAKLTVDERGYFTLEDLGSKNGIMYCERTTQRINLIDGDVFHIGRTKLEFHAVMPRIEKVPIPEAELGSIMADVDVPPPTDVED